MTRTAVLVKGKNSIKPDRYSLVRKRDFEERLVQRKIVKKQNLWQQAKKNKYTSRTLVQTKMAWYLTYGNILWDYNNTANWMIKSVAVVYIWVRKSWERICIIISHQRKRVDQKTRMLIIKNSDILTLFVE